MYPLFETIKIIDGVPQNLFWHQIRYEYSYKELYGAIPKFKMVDELDIPGQYSTGLIKLRLSYNNKSFSYEFSSYNKKKVQSLQLLENDKIDYSLKFSNRKSIDDLFQLRGDCDDILIIKEKRITDCSFANVVFYDGNNWVTPSVPLLKGTCRERLLSEKEIKEHDILIDDLPLYSKLKLINAMLDLEDQEALDISAIKS